MPSSPPGGLCLCSTRHSHAHRSAGSGPQSAAPQGTQGYWPGPTAQRAPGKSRPQSVPLTLSPGPSSKLFVVPPRSYGVLGLQLSQQSHGLPHYSGMKTLQATMLGAAESGFQSWPEPIPPNPGPHGLSRRLPGPSFHCLQTAASSQIPVT